MNPLYTYSHSAAVMKYLTKEKGFSLDISTTLLYTQDTVNMTEYSVNHYRICCPLQILAAG